MNDPWFKTTLQSSAFGIKLNFNVPHDVFSTQQIDEGTVLFLKHLPTTLPNTVLDMGCGYGALGLSIAAKFHKTIFDLVDRDLLAVKWSNINAQLNNLSNVNAYGSLGFRDLKQKKYDWILCNVPARIGKPFIENFFKTGQTLLNSNGEIRVVVINDLVNTLLEIKTQCNLDLIEVVRGPRHSVFSLSASERKSVSIIEAPDLYLRDQVEINGIKFDRPFDLGGDDPKRLKTGLPIFFDAFPRQFSNGKIFCFRSGYWSIATRLSYALARGKCDCSRS